MKVIHHIFTRDFTKEVTKKRHHRKEGIVSYNYEKYERERKKNEILCRRTTDDITHITEKLHPCVIKFLC